MVMRVFRPYWLGLALLAAQAPLPAQVGYPGGYPNGQYPGAGGVGIPIPRRHKKNDQAELDSVSGMLRRLQKDQVILEADDHRILNLKRTATTHFLKMGNPIQPSDLHPGDFIEIEYSQDDEGFMTAVNVLWQQDGSAKDREHAAEPVETSLAKDSHDRDKASAPEKASPPASQPPAPQAKPAPAAQPAQASAPNPADLNAPIKGDVEAVKIDPDDEGPPVLHRGGSEEHKPIAPAAGGAGAAAPAVQRPQRPEEVVIDQARQAAAGFLTTLPDYFCREVMTRYQSESTPANWQPIDVISMALVYDKGRESYRNITINGKATKKSIEDLPGSWSTGEFGTVLADVFSPATAADFEFRDESRSNGRAALVYDFSVDREHSHWQIMIASQLVTPSYQGSVWIDKQTKRVLRIEMQATHMPDAFPTDDVEMATDYDFIRIGDRQFLVPVHAETLSCQRDSSLCSHNVIDFRNYHKFAGESSITFDQ